MKRKIYFLPSCFVLLSNLLFAQKNEEILKNYFNNSAKYRSLNSANKQFAIKTEDYSTSMKSTVLQVQQTFLGVPVYNSYGNVVIKNEKLLSINENFYKSSIVSKQEKADNVEIIFSKVLNNASIEKGTYSLSEKGKPNSVFFKKVYFPLDNELKLAYLYQFEEEGSSNYWSIVADATSGEIFEKQNLNLSCRFDGNHDKHEEHEINKFVKPENKPFESTLSFLSPDNASYRVYALPVEAPSFGVRTLVTNPWDLTVSPEGWHSDGNNHYTYTRGNNVYAYTDVTNTNTASVENATDGGASRIFDFPIDLTQYHTAYKDAAVTNLFYMNNKIHDIMYKFGFNETWRNFQTTNFTTLGSGNDAVNAEARDASEATTQKLNNANFATPADGSSPRMQMYLWDPASVNRLVYNAPSTFASRKPDTKDAAFGPALTNARITANVALTTPVDGCTAISENLYGKIALIQRGSCNFTVKVKNAQNNGAVAAIIYNAPTSAYIGQMGGVDTTVTIPSILIENSEGVAIANQLSSTPVNVTISDDETKHIYIDADLDNGIIAHEYGHGVSNRLIGTTATCLNQYNSNEQMGEGWSDFLALMMTNQPGDTASVPRGVGTFSSAEATNGLGIRPAKYSPNFTINNYTYGRTNGMSFSDGSSNVHSIGFVWATMLWDLHWKYVEKYGYSSDVTANPNSGSARVLQLVTDAMKVTACSPTFIDGRDAILQAELSTTEGTDKCMIWGVFAKRGLGVKASAGLKKSITPVNSTNMIAALNDQVEDFTYPAECSSSLSSEEVTLNKEVQIYPNPAKNEIFIKSNSLAIGETIISVYDATGKLVISEKKNLKSQNTVDTSRLSNGIYIIKGEGIGVNFSQKIIIEK